MNIHILIPIHKTMDAPCVQSLIAMTTDLYMDGHKVKFIFANGFNAARARQGLLKTLCEDAKKFQSEYALWVDSDHLYYKDNFDSLVKTMKEKDLPLLSGTYKMRGSEETAHGRHNDKGVFEHIHYKELNDLPEGSLVDASVIGFGFVVMKTSWLCDLWTKHGDDLFKMDIGENGTEDVAFCTKVLKDGHKILFDPKVRIGHIEIAVRI